MAHTQILTGSPLPTTAGPRREPLRPGPLAGRYPAAAAMVVLFLVPYLALSSALRPLAPIIAGQLHMSAQAMSLTSGMANAAYAAGAVIALQLAQLLPQRRLLVVYAGLLVAGSVLAAAATGPAMFIAGHILQGLCTSLLLVAAVPPLFLGYPVGRLRWSAVIMNLCLFGAVTAGPLIGGAQASFHAWRPLFWILAGLAAVALLLSLLTFTDAPPADRAAPRDGLAIALAAGGSAAAFWGASELTTHRFLDPVVVVPLLGGLALIIVLWVYSYRARRSLLAVRALASTIPVSGIVVAICAAAAAGAAIGLTATVIAPHYTPLRLGVLYAPELAGAVLSAVVFGVVFTSRLIHYYVLTGMAFLVAGVLVIRSPVPPTQVVTLVGSGLIGVGVGATVGPALFLIGFSVRAGSVQRVFAILALLRTVAAFMTLPVLLHFATGPAGVPTAVMSTALWICFGLAAGGAIVAVSLYLLGGARPAAPRLERWMDGQQPAWESPPLLAAVRRAVPPHVLARAGSGANGGLAASTAGRLRRFAAHEGRGRPGSVMFGYDGSQLAKTAIAEAGRQLPGHRDALVVTVWRTFSVGFVPEPGTQFDAARSDQVREAAEQTAARGAALAEAAGFRAHAMAVEGTPAWKAIMDAADDHDASLIVLGSRGRAGLGGLVAGSVAGAVVARSRRPVLIVHDQASAPETSPPSSAEAVR